MHILAFEIVKCQSINAQHIEPAERAARDVGCRGRPTERCQRRRSTTHQIQEEQKPEPIDISQQ